MVSVECRSCGKESSTCTHNTLLSLPKNMTIRKAVEEYIADTDVPDYTCEKYVKKPHEYKIDK